MSLSQAQRAQIAKSYIEGYTARKIGAKCDVSKTAVHAAMINWRLRRSCSELKSSGRSKEITVGDDHLMKRMVV